MASFKQFSVLFSAMVLMMIATESSSQAADPLVYIGTYTRGDSQGIYVFRFNSESGELTPVTAVSGVKNPSFLAISPDQKYLYSVAEIDMFDGQKAGGVAAFSIDKASGNLTKLNEQHSGGAGPCHLVVDKEGKNVLVANYGGGSVSALPIGEDGQLKPPSSTIQHEGSSVNPQRQKEPHAHSVNLDPAGKFAFVADLGLDKVLIYRFDSAKGELKANNPPSASVSPGGGPRHFAFHPNGKFAYVINEIGNTVTAFAYSAEEGRLTPIESLSTIPADYKETTHTAEVQVHPSGKFVYGSNRGHDSIAVFQVNQDTGKLTAKGQAKCPATPRNFGMDPGGKFLLACGQSANQIEVFRINQDTGELTSTGHKVKVPSPVCVKFLKP
jgi:6-phosphogluconolactonase